MATYLARSLDQITANRNVILPGGNRLLMIVRHLRGEPTAQLIISEHGIDSSFELVSIKALHDLLGTAIDRWEG